jgi:hypothetical protein
LRQERRFFLFKTNFLFTIDRNLAAKTTRRIDSVGERHIASRKTFSATESSTALGPRAILLPTNLTVIGKSK